MSRTIKFLFTISAVFIFVFVTAGMANAAGSGCVVPGWINIAGNGMDAQVRLTNNVSCGPMTVSVCSYRVYQFPTGTVGWLKNQTLFDSKTVTLQPGQTVYTTVKTDNCMSQIDVFEGPCVYPFPSDNPHDLNTIVGGQVTNYHELCTNKCTNECALNQRTCNGNGYKICKTGSNGCTHWEHADCPSGQTCSGGYCAASCTNECALNQRTCDGNGYKICKTGSNGCTHWEHADCPSGQTCSGGYCAASCTNECSSNGQRMCSGNSWKQCGNYDSDSCLEWGNITQCSWNQTCVNGSCVNIPTYNPPTYNPPTYNPPAYNPPTYNPPTVNLDYSGQVNCGQNATLRWTSTNATACQAGGSWSGSKATSGSEQVGNFTGSRTYSITCTGSGGSASDSVSLTGTADDLEVDAGPDKDINDNENSVRLDGSVDGNYDSLSWSCTGGDLSSSSSLRPTFYSPSYNDNDNDWDYDRTYTCTLTARNECGADSDAMRVRVERDNDDQDFDVSLIARPKSDCAPLDDVDLTATVSNYDNNDWGDNYDRDFTYYFDCENDGHWDKTVTTDDTSYTAANLCDYRNVGDYTARVRVERENRAATDTEIVRAEQCGIAATGDLSITKTVSNLSRGTDYQGTVSANPLNTVAYRIVVTGIAGTANNVTVTDALPAGIANIRDLRVDGATVGSNLSSGISLGTIVSGQTKTITYTATVANDTSFAYGQTTLTNVATVTADGKSANSSAAVTVNRQAVMGATTISTGFDNQTLAGLGLGLAAAILCLAWVVKTRIIDPKRDPRQLLREKIAAVRKGM